MVDRAPSRARADGQPALAWRMIGWGFIIGAVSSVVLVLLALRATEVPPADSGASGYVRTFSPPRTAFEVLLLHGDGQAYAQLAQDPGLARPGAWVLGAESMSFFAHRPLLPYSAWGLSGGRSDYLAPAFVAITGLAGGLLVSGAVAVLQTRGRGQDARLGVAVLVIPTVVVCQTVFGPDLLGPALGLIGLALWRCSPAHRGWAAVAFVLGVLARESIILIPFMVGAYELIHHRLRVRDAARLLAPVVAYAGWTLVVRWRVGVGPEATARGATVSLPLAGVRRAWQADWTGVDAAALLLLFVVLGVAAVQHRRELEAWIVAAYLLMALVLNENVWRAWTEIGRVLVPAAVLALVLLVPARPSVMRRLPPEAGAPVAPVVPDGAPRAVVGHDVTTGRKTKGGNGLPICGVRL